MKARIFEKRRDLKSELSERYPDLFLKYPLTLYIKEIQSYREYNRYFFVSPKLTKTFNDMERGFPDQAIALYHKLSLCTFILDALQRLNSQNTPSRIINLYHEWFERVGSDFSTQPDKYYSFKNDSFWKDLSVCSGKAIPVGGAWIVVPALIRLKHLVSPNLSGDEKKVSTIASR